MRVELNPTLDYVVEVVNGDTNKVVERRACFFEQMLDLIYQSAWMLAQSESDIYYYMNVYDKNGEMIWSTEDE